MTSDNWGTPTHENSTVDTWEEDLRAKSTETSDANTNDPWGSPNAKIAEDAGDVSTKKSASSPTKLTSQNASKSTQPATVDETENLAIQTAIENSLKTFTDESTSIPDDDQWDPNYDNVVASSSKHAPSSECLSKVSNGATRTLTVTADQDLDVTMKTDDTTAKHDPEAPIVKLEIYINCKREIIKREVYALGEDSQKLAMHIAKDVQVTIGSSRLNGKPSSYHASASCEGESESASKKIGPWCLVKEPLVDFPAGILTSPNVSIPGGAWGSSVSYANSKLEDRFVTAHQAPTTVAWEAPIQQAVSNPAVEKWGAPVQGMLGKAINNDTCAPAHHSQAGSESGATIHHTTVQEALVESRDGSQKESAEEDQLEKEKAPWLAPPGSIKSDPDPWGAPIEQPEMKKQITDDRDFPVVKPSQPAGVKQNNAFVENNKIGNDLWGTSTTGINTAVTDTWNTTMNNAWDHSAQVASMPKAGLWGVKLQDDDDNWKSNLAQKSSTSGSDERNLKRAQTRLFGDNEWKAHPNTSRGDGWKSEAQLDVSEGDELMSGARWQAQPDKSGSDEQKSDAQWQAQTDKSGDDQRKSGTQRQAQPDTSGGDGWKSDANWLAQPDAPGGDDRKSGAQKQSQPETSGDDSWKSDAKWLVQPNASGGNNTASWRTQTDKADDRGSGAWDKHGDRYGDGTDGSHSDRYTAGAGGSRGDRYGAGSGSGYGDSYGSGLGAGYSGTYGSRDTYGSGGSMRGAYNDTYSRRDTGGGGSGGRGAYSGGNDCCRNCGKEGHFARDCPDKDCYNCGERGHFSRDCPRKDHSCEKEGHSSRDCPSRGICYKCMKPGHIMRNCPEEDGNERSRKRDSTLMSGHQTRFGKAERRECFKCGSADHIARECTEQQSVSDGYNDGHRIGGSYRGGRGGRCSKCNEEGHPASDCPGTGSSMSSSAGRSEPKSAWTQEITWGDATSKRWNGGEEKSTWDSQSQRGVGRTGGESSTHSEDVPREDRDRRRDERDVSRGRNGRPKPVNSAFDQGDRSLSPRAETTSVSNVTAKPWWL